MRVTCAHRMRYSAAAAGLCFAIMLQAGCSNDQPVAAGGAQSVPSGPIATPPATDGGVLIPPDPGPQPTPPTGAIHPWNGKPLFSLRVDEPNVALTTHGFPPGVGLNARLASAGGQREIQLVDSTGRAETVAPAGWNMPAVGAMRSDGALLVCWNRLDGPEPAPGAMPHPSTGLSVVCRFRSGSAFGDQLVAGDVGSPCWLVDVEVDGSVFRITYFHNANGWLVGPSSAGDGILTRTCDGKTLSDASAANP